MDDKQHMASVFDEVDTEEANLIMDIQGTLARKAIEDVSDVCYNWEKQPHVFVCKPHSNEPVNFINDAFIKAVLVLLKLGPGEW